MIPLAIPTKIVSSNLRKRSNNWFKHGARVFQIFHGMTRRAVTLVELLVSIGILGIIVIVVGNLFIAAGRYAAAEQSRIDVSEGVSRVFSTLDRTVRQGKAILASSGADTTSGTTMVFSLPSIDASNNLSATLIDTVVISVDSSDPNNKKLRMTITPDATSTRPAVDQTIVDHVQDVYFRYTSDTPRLATGVTMTVAVTRTILNRSFTQINIINLILRNHA